MTEPILISIEANIGAGKSTIIHNLIGLDENKDNKSTTTYVPEPIYKWEKFRDPETDRSLLELYYENPQKYAFSLQTMIYNSFSWDTTEEPKTPLIVTERSQKSCSGIFAKMLYHSGIMSSVEYQVYMNCIANKPLPLDICIYLRTTPEVCYERVKYRNRHGEHGISLEYLRTCHEAHETWISEINDNKTTERKTHVKIIDVGTKTPEEITTEISEILSDLSYI